MTGRWVERARDFGRGLVVRDAPDPRAAQTLFLLLVLADLSLRVAGGLSRRARCCGRGRSPG